MVAGILRVSNDEREIFFEMEFAFDRYFSSLKTMYARDKTARFRALSSNNIELFFSETIASASNFNSFISSLSTAKAMSAKARAINFFARLFVSFA